MPDMNSDGRIHCEKHHYLMIRIAGAEEDDALAS
jgi:hypothetical protein